MRGVGVSSIIIWHAVSINMVTHFPKVLAGTFELALLYMKVVDCILTSQNDAFGNIAVYNSNVI